MSIAETVQLQDMQRQIEILQSQMAQLLPRLVALEKQAVSDNTLHLKGRKRGD